MAALLTLAQAAPASAAGTLTTQAATNVGIVSATLNGTATGFPAGTYCSFNWEQDSGPGATAHGRIDNEPAELCGSGGGGSISYSVPFVGIYPGTTYTFYAVACQQVTTSGSSHYCDSNYGNTAIDTQCTGSSPPSCPTFTTSEPSATTNQPTSVLGTSATLNATLNIQDLTTQQSGIDSSHVSWYFEYSTDSTFGAYTQTPTQTLSAANTSSTVPVSAPVTGLTSGTTYYYRIVLDLSSEVTQSGDYLAYGSSLSFTTGGRVVTDSATQLANNSATLNGEVISGNDPLSYHWVYSTGDVVSGGVLQGTSVGSGSVLPGQDQIVSTNLTGLSPGTSYHFQLVASDQTTNASITGAILTLTTAGAACPAGATQQQDTAIPGTGFVVSGCFTASAGPPTAAEPWVGYGPVTINGLSLSGPTTQTVKLSADKLTISDGYSLSLGDTPLRVAGSGSLSFDYTDSSACSTPGAGGCDSTVTVVPDPSTGFFGFPILAPVTITAHGPGDSGNPGGADVSVAALGLPALFGGVTAQGSATVSESGSISDISAQLGDATIGPLSLPEISFSYTAASNSWTGTADLMFPLAKYGVQGSVTVSNGRLTALSAGYSGPGIPLGDTGLELNAVNVDATFDPFSLGGGVGVGFGPQVLGTNLLEGNVNLLVAYDSSQRLSGLPGIPDGYTLPNVPVTISISGNLQLLGFITLAQAQASIYAIPGNPLVTATAQFGQPLLANCPTQLGGGQFGFDSQLNIAGDATKSDFNLVGSGSDLIYLCGLGDFGVQGATAISTVGFDICGSIPHVGVLGYGVDWSSFSALPSDPKQLLSGLQLYGSGSCDVSPYEATVQLPPEAARAAAAGLGTRLATLHLHHRLPFEVLRFRGRGAPPTVALRGPHGLAFAMRPGAGSTASRRGYLVIQDPFNDTTYVELDHPAPGGYALSTVAGSSPVVHVSASAGLSAPSVHAHLAGHGIRRVLRWRARARPGQRLVFREVGAGGDRLLLSTRRNAGALRYRVRAGLRGRRYVIAQVFEAGHLQRVIRIARYSGPVIRRPNRPLSASAIRTHRRVTVSWRQRGQRPARWLVLVAERNGARVLYPVRRERLVLRGAAAARAVSVSVTAENALGQKGPARAVRVRSKPVKHRRHRQ